MDTALNLIRDACIYNKKQWMQRILEMQTVDRADHSVLIGYLHHFCKDLGNSTGEETKRTYESKKKRGRRALKCCLLGIE